ncbi:CheY-like superfamily [Pilaira anomala]|nr:CheY-like superfamily [Pilaira anomala]
MTVQNNCRELSILIVDDNPINILIMKKSLYKLLNKKRLEIKEASNGVEALELVKHFQFDIILLDIDMPLLNGMDTTKCLRKNGQTIPIIAVTTNDSIESRNTYIQIGMNDCLSKPIDLCLLEQALTLLLSKSAFRDVLTRPELLISSPSKLD